MIAHFDDRRDFRMAEGSVTIGENALQIRFRNIREQPHDFECQVHIGKTAPGRKTVTDIRNDCRKQQAAVAGKPGHDGILKSKRFAAASGADIMHGQKCP